ncbi:MAG: cupin domain-containing protein [Dehalococcoidia bacterium]|nr:cupin domain-containing protein [Dehalococcoidia bacterium]
MSTHIAMPPIYLADARQQVRYTPEGPQPQFVLDGDQAKVILAGLEAGQRIPVHPEALAVYVILEGQGVMQVGEQEFPIGPGSLVVTPAGSARGMVAETRLAFAAVKIV